MNYQTYLVVLSSRFSSVHTKLPLVLSVRDLNWLSELWRRFLTKRKCESLNITRNSFYIITLMVKVLISHEGGNHTKEVIAVKESLYRWLTNIYV